MPRDQESLIDIANAIRRILRYANGISKPELEVNDEKLALLINGMFFISRKGAKARKINSSIC